ncbi:MAG TPA: hypothetical protein VGH44_00920 [Candidatus Saccharimonadia bacterium]|jgi:hypothetical protein
MAQLKQKEPFLLQDRWLMAALCFGSSGYIVLGSWPGVLLLVAAFMVAVFWAFRTASSHPRLGYRLLATLLLVVMGAFLTVYVAVREGLIK